MGPGLITAASDNDAGGITTWSVAGARFGYQLLWVLLLITPILAVTQEMGARMGVVTGKGLAALIRERFSLRMTAFAMLAMLVANFGTTVAEFSGRRRRIQPGPRPGLARRATGRRSASGCSSRAAPTAASSACSSPSPPSTPPTSSPAFWPTPIGDARRTAPWRRASPPPPSGS